MIKRLIFILVLVIGVTACGNYPTGYKLIAQKKAFARFSFECPIQYVRLFMPHVEIETYHIKLSSFYRDKNVPIDSNFSITAWKPGDSGSFTDANGLMEARLSLYKGITDFQIIEHYQFIVAGVQADGYEFSYTTPWAGHQPAHGISRVVYFDHNNSVWEIDTVSDASRTEANKADFEHILKTFRVLE